MSDLKPCPFCGNEPDSRTSDTDGNKYYTCGSRWCRNGNWYTLEEWNKRPLETDGWIAVSEPPTKSMYVLICEVGDEFARPAWYAEDNGDFYWWGDKQCADYWMPLPEPPEVTK